MLTLLCQGELNMIVNLEGALK
uniref:Uncharacterized protein n=1 Tax=Arundo donax TaxID=35708 RepID=A0A0A9I2H2_ARUDO